MRSLPPPQHRHRNELKAVETYQRSRVDAKVEAYQKAQKEEEEERRAIELARDGHVRAVKRLQGYMMDIKHKMGALSSGIASSDSGQFASGRFVD